MNAGLPPSMRFEVSESLPSVTELGRCHVLAVGGAGMSAVARLLHAAGVVVSGADVQDSVTLQALAQEGIQVWVGHDSAHLSGVDTVVFSSAIREDNVELAAARAAGLRVLHRSQALAVLMHMTGAEGRPRRGVAVAGANGKTTTSSMLAEALSVAGADPSYAVGGELIRAGTNAAWGEGDTFVVEADESDGSFLVYGPEVAVVTNVQPDHLDFYGTFDGVRRAYEEFVRTISPGGVLVACADDEGSARLARWAAEQGVRVVTYGESDEADVRVTQPSFDGLSSRATVRHAGVEYELQVGVPGWHNVVNATAAWVAAVEGVGADPSAVLAGLAGFAGARRRFESRGTAAGVRVVDDYAHNPGKVAAVVGTARRLASPGRLVVLFQPHLYSRTRDFADAFGTALAAADVVLVMDVYGAREDPMPGVDGGLVAREVVAAQERQGRRGLVEFVADRHAVLDRLRAVVTAGDLVVTVGAGDVTRWGPLLLAQLEDAGADG
ncbi:UDP-N-acetylmuramate--L-alanine ligase [Austwickia sp. TVS 96-490-7B]|uniref:UDP-N-acetylmuramate--L-alanine ligase n=1 Tax=Austwickia sp. TVS 96-490-7B TaxID=2830843 RepID=UPI001C56ED74|nr:UDP-N-acetylmuramate--L-alanine ligase [Austwickia sp. TVS 96-490-7B]MBW3084402.1 UDP-N-acetylmuramate--L-alanine ligase [Austwickia sp. TVS 96-490-7B]